MQSPAMSSSINFFVACSERQRGGKMGDMIAVTFVFNLIGQNQWADSVQSPKHLACASDRL